MKLSRRGLTMYRQIVPFAHALQAELMQPRGKDELRAFDAVLGKLQECAERLAPGVETGATVKLPHA